MATKILVRRNLHKEIVGKQGARTSPPLSSSPPLSAVPALFFTITKRRTMENKINFAPLEYNGEMGNAMLTKIF